MRIVCESCGTAYKIPAERLTKSVHHATCKRCGHKIVIRVGERPAAESAPAEAAPFIVPPPAPDHVSAEQPIGSADEAPTPPSVVAAPDEAPTPPSVVAAADEAPTPVSPAAMGEHDPGITAPELVATAPIETPSELDEQPTRPGMPAITGPDESSTPQVMSTDFKPTAADTRLSDPDPSIEAPAHRPTDPIFPKPSSVLDEHAPNLAAGEGSEEVDEDATPVPAEIAATPDPSGAGTQAPPGEEVAAEGADVAADSDQVFAADNSLNEPIADGDEDEPIADGDEEEPSGDAHSDTVADSEDPGADSEGMDASSEDTSGVSEDTDAAADSEDPSADSAEEPDTDSEDVGADTEDTTDGEDTTDSEDTADSEDTTDSENSEDTTDTLDEEAAAAEQDTVDEQGATSQENTEQSSGDEPDGPEEDTTGDLSGVLGASLGLGVLGAIALLTYAMGLLPGSVPVAVPLTLAYAACVSSVLAALPSMRKRGAMPFMMICLVVGAALGALTQILV